MHCAGSDHRTPKIALRRGRGCLSNVRRRVLPREMISAPEAAYRCRCPPQPFRRPSRIAADASPSRPAAVPQPFRADIIPRGEAFPKRFPARWARLTAEEGDCTRNTKAAVCVALFIRLFTSKRLCNTDKGVRFLRFRLFGRGIIAIIRRWSVPAFRERRQYRRCGRSGRSGSIGSWRRCRRCGSIGDAAVCTLAAIQNIVLKLKQFEYCV